MVSNLLQRRQQSATGDLTVADIVSGATVRIVAGKDGSAFAAENVQVSGTTTQSGGSNRSSGSTQSGGTSGSSQSTDACGKAQRPVESGAAAAVLTDLTPAATCA